MVLSSDYKTSVGRSIFLFNLLQTFFNGTPSLWQYRLWSFKLSDTKLDRYLAKNEYIVLKKISISFEVENGKT